MVHRCNLFPRISFIACKIWLNYVTWVCSEGCAKPIGSQELIMHVFPTPHSVASFWLLEVGHSGTTYSVEVRKYYSSELPSSPEIHLLSSYVSKWASSHSLTSTLSLNLGTCLWGEWGQQPSETGMVIWGIRWGEQRAHERKGPLYKWRITVPR